MISCASVSLKASLHEIHSTALRHVAVAMYSPCINGHDEHPGSHFRSRVRVIFVDWAPMTSALTDLGVISVRLEKIVGNVGSSCLYKDIVASLQSTELASLNRLCSHIVTLTTSFSSLGALNMPLMKSIAGDPMHTSRIWQLGEDKSQSYP